MPDWSSPAELAVEGGKWFIDCYHCSDGSDFLFRGVAAFAKFMHALAGLYL